MIERFDALGDDYYESPSGRFVLASDYDALAARLAEAERVARSLMPDFDMSGDPWHAGRYAAGEDILRAIGAADNGAACIGPLGWKVSGDTQNVEYNCTRCLRDIKPVNGLLICRHCTEGTPDSENAGPGSAFVVDGYVICKRCGASWDEHGTTAHEYACPERPAVSAAAERKSE